MRGFRGGFATHEYGAVEAHPRSDRAAIKSGYGIGLGVKAKVGHADGLDPEAVRGAQADGGELHVGGFKDADGSVQNTRSEDTALLVTVERCNGVEAADADALHGAVGGDACGP